VRTVAAAIMLMAVAACDHGAPRAALPDSPLATTSASADQSRPQPSATPPHLTTAAPPPCPATQLTAGFAGSAVAETGEHSAFITIINDGHRPCQLGGYPAVQLLHNGQALRFRDRHGGQYIDGLDHDVRDVTIGPGATASFLIAKYRCDAGELRAATTVAFQAHGVIGTLNVTIPTRGRDQPDLAYCRAFNGRPNRTDPGNRIHISRLAAGRGDGD
jgi:hypothetical protein